MVPLFCVEYKNNRTASLTFFIRDDFPYLELDPFQHLRAKRNNKLLFWKGVPFLDKYRKMRICFEDNNDLARELASLSYFLSHPKNTITKDDAITADRKN